MTWFSNPFEYLEVSVKESDRFKVNVFRVISSMNWTVGTFLQLCTL